MKDEENPFSPNYKSVLTKEKPPKKFKESSKSAFLQQRVWSRNFSEQFRDSQFHKLRTKI